MFVSFLILIYSVRTNKAYWDFYSGIEIFTLSNENLHKGKKKTLVRFLIASPQNKLIIPCMLFCINVFSWVPNFGIFYLFTKIKTLELSVQGKDLQCNHSYWRRHDGIFLNAYVWFYLFGFTYMKNYLCFVIDCLFCITNFTSKLMQHSNWIKKFWLFLLTASLLSKSVQVYYTCLFTQSEITPGLI